MHLRSTIILTALSITVIVVFSVAVPVTVRSEDTSASSGDNYPQWYYNGRAHGVEGRPSFRQIWSLPSLTPEQRRKIVEVAGASIKEQARINEQRSALKKQLRMPEVHVSKYVWNAATSESTMSHAEIIRKRAELHQQARALGLQTWQAVKPILTPDQLRELKDQAVKSAPQEMNN